MQALERVSPSSTATDLLLGAERELHVRLPPRREPQGRSQRIGRVSDDVGTGPAGLGRLVTCRAQPPKSPPAERP